MGNFGPLPHVSEWRTSVGLGTGLSHQEWTSEDVSKLLSLRLPAVSTFKLLLFNFYTRKLKVLSVHIASGEENIMTNNMHGGIQSFLNEHQFQPSH